MSTAHEVGKGVDSAVTQEDIAQSINEWPISFQEDLYTSDIDRIRHPQSVSRFFLRNVRRQKERLTSDAVKEEGQSQPTTEDEVLVDVALAKWWRREGRKCIDSSLLPNSENPDTILNFVSSTDPGFEFVRNGIKRLRDKIASGSRGSDVHNALASYYEKAGSLSPAKMHLEAAIDKAPKDKELKWKLMRLKRMIAARQQQENVLHGINFSSDSQLTVPKSKQVKRVSAESLSFEEFFKGYALKSIPVIITDLVPYLTTVPWTMQHIADVAGECLVKLKKHVNNSVQWAHLEDSQTMKVKEYIQHIQDHKTINDMYLFDWNIPCNCQALAKELIIPKYFAGDFLQRTSEGSLYKDSWPSLFIASQGLTSDLHVDTFGSNFWMALFEGRKRWVFYDKKDQYKLYPVYKQPWSTDPGFQVNLINPDLMEQPLLSVTEPIECILEAGEVLFVPAGCPHRVENLEQSLAISANYVDLSNFDLVKEELTVSGLLDERSEELCNQLNDKNFPSSMAKDVEHLPWERFKNWTQQDYDENSISYDLVKNLKSTEENDT